MLKALTCFSVLTLFTLPFFYSTNVVAQSDPRVLQFDEKRSDYKSELSNLKTRIKNESDELNTQLREASNSKSKISSEINELRQEISQLDSESFSLGLQIKGLATALIPELFLFEKTYNKRLDEFVTTLFYCVLIWLILLVLSAVFSKRKKLSQKAYWFYFCLSVLAVLMIGSAAAEESPPTLDQSLSEQFEKTNALLSMNEHQRYDKLLRSVKRKSFTLPELESGSQFLKVYREVVNGSGEYYITLAGINSYLGKSGVAVDEIAKVNYKFTERKNRDQIFVNSLKFLIEKNQIEAASKLFENRVAQVNDSDKLISLAEFMNKNNMESSAQKSINRAKKIAKNTSELLKLSSYLYEANQNELANSALKLGFSRATTYAELSEVTEVMSSHSIMPPAENLYNKFKSIYQSQIRTKLKSSSTQEVKVSVVKSGIQMMDRLVIQGYNEMALEWYSFMIRDRDLAMSSMAFQETLLHKAIANDWYEQASQAVSQMVRSVGKEKRFTYQVSLPKGSTIADGLPDSENISLPALSGVLFEKQSFSDKAKTAYSRSVINTLDKLIGSVGVEVVGDINSFFLLGEVLKKERDYEALAKLDRTYTLVEKNNLRSIDLDHTETSLGIKEDIQKLSESSSVEGEELKVLKSQFSHELGEVFRLKVARLGIIFLLLLLIVYSVHVSYIYCKSEKEQRFFAGIHKFFETLGWVKVYSIVGAISGFILIWFGQIGLIFKRIPEEVTRLNNYEPPSNEGNAEANQKLENPSSKT